MPYGKYKGVDMEEIPSNYLRWVAENFDDDVVASKADEEWQFRERTGSHQDE